MPKVIAFFFLIFFFPANLIAEELREIIKKPFTYQSIMTTNEILLGETIFITNWVRKKNLNVAGKLVMVKITHLEEKQDAFHEEEPNHIFQGITDINGFWGLAFEETHRPGTYQVSAIFFDNQKIYQENIIQYEFKVVDDKKIQREALIFFCALFLVFLPSVIVFTFKLNLPFLLHASPVFFLLSPSPLWKKEGLFSLIKLPLLLSYTYLLSWNEEAFFYAYVLSSLLIYSIQKMETMKIILVELILIYLFYDWFMDYQDHAVVKNWFENPAWHNWAWAALLLPNFALWFSLAFLTFLLAPFAGLKITLLAVISSLSILGLLLYHLFFWVKKNYLQ